MEQFALKVQLSPSKDIKPNVFYYIDDVGKPLQAINCYDCIKIYEQEKKYRQDSRERMLTLPMQEIVIDFKTMYVTTKDNMKKKLIKK